MTATILEYEALQTEFNFINQQLQVIHLLSSLSSLTTTNTTSSNNNIKVEKQWESLNTFYKLLTAHVTNNAASLATDRINKAKTVNRNSVRELKPRHLTTKYASKDMHIPRTYISSSSSSSLSSKIQIPTTTAHTNAASSSLQTIDSVYDYKLLQIKQALVDIRHIASLLSPDTVWYHDKCVSLDWSHKQLSCAMSSELATLTHLMHLSFNSSDIQGNVQSNLL